MAARTTIPDFIHDQNAVLPTFLMTQLPPWLGALALSAVFSTEVDTCDAILFMLSTSVSKDIYMRHINPRATDAQLLRVARLSAVAGGAAGVVLSIMLATVIGALTIFYSIIVVSLFVPILGGLYIRRASSAAALAAIGAGLAALFAVRVAVTPVYRWADPVVAGLLAGAAAFAIVIVRQRPVRPGQET
jgi:SSS family solute:Na+ symporter